VQQRGEGKAYGAVVPVEVCWPHAVASPPMAANHKSLSPLGWHHYQPHTVPSPSVAESWERARESTPVGFTRRTAATTPPRRTPNTQGRICGRSMT
jgi:hypothetical protein